jgi:hypothetical protein
MSLLRTALLATAVVAATAAGCGEASTPVVDLGPVERPREVPAASGQVVTSQPVLVTGSGAGTHLCFGSLTFGGPPECEDAEVRGWDWSEHDGEYTTEDGVSWGSFLLTGTYDAQAFTPTEVLPGSAYEPDGWDFTIPCEEPAGGWRVLDPARATQDDLTPLTSVAEGLPGYALAAVSTPDGDPGPDDPLQTVVTVLVAGDPVRAEAELRKSWGGMLCVHEVEHSMADLERVQRELSDLPGLIEVGLGMPSNMVEMTVFHDDGRYQRWVDEEFGAGLVEVSSVLRPAG